MLWRAKKIDRNSGFTLIELLVVIAIIGLLASIVVYALQKARTSGRDTKRKADIAQFQKAMELYYDDYGIYPPLAGGSPTGLEDWLLADSLKAYTITIPKDPKISCNRFGVCSNNYQISENDTQTGYAIMINFEAITPCKKVSAGADPSQFFGSTPTCNY